MKKTILYFMLHFGMNLQAQTLERMTWFNEPEQWQIYGKTLLTSSLKKHVFYN